MARLTAGQDVVVFPVRRSMGLEGIGIKTPDGRSFYFLVNDRSAVLAAVAAAGFQVSGQEQKMKLRQPAPAPASAPVAQLGL